MIEYRKVHCNIIIHKMEMCHSNQFHRQNRKTIVRSYKVMAIQQMETLHRINGIALFVFESFYCKNVMKVFIILFSSFHRMDLELEIKMDFTIHQHNLITISNKIKIQFLISKQCNQIMDRQYMLITLDHIHTIICQGFY